MLFAYMIFWRLYTFIPITDDLAAKSAKLGITSPFHPFML
jgi:hypothetical protein